MTEHYVEERKLVEKILKKYLLFFLDLSSGDRIGDQIEEIKTDLLDLFVFVESAY